MALLGLLHTVAPSAGWRLAVAHIDHGLRAESGADAQLVTSLAASLGLPVRCKRLSLPTGPGLAARARTARRGALTEIARAVGARTVALGHTQTDQAETVLLHLVRGAGLTGLSGMRTTTGWAAGSPRDGLWWRPLLGFARHQTRALARRLGLPFVDDPTNADRDKPRTLIRHEVLPRLAGINPEVVTALATAAGHAARADEALAQWAGDALQRRVEPSASPTSSTVYDISDLATLPGEVRRRLIRAVCCEAGLVVDAIPARVVEDLDAALCGHNHEPNRPRSWDLHPRTRAHVAGGRFWLAPRPDEPTPETGRESTKQAAHTAPASSGGAVDATPARETIDPPKPGG